MLPVHVVREAAGSSAGNRWWRGKRELIAIGESERVRGSSGRRECRDVSSRVVANANDASIRQRLAYDATCRVMGELSGPADRIGDRGEESCRVIGEHEGSCADTTAPGHGGEPSARIVGQSG